MIPHLLIILSILIIATIHYYYRHFLPTIKTDLLKKPEEFSDFEQTYAKYVSEIITPKNYSTFKLLTEFKI
jgi:hypothetical protein